MRSLRIQLLISHLSLVLLVGLILSGAVLSFISLRGSIDSVLSLNYPTILATQDLESAMREQRLGFETILRGDTVRGAGMVQSNASRSADDIARMADLLTEPEEVSAYGTLVALHSRYAATAVRLADANQLSVQPGLEKVRQEQLEPQIREILFLTSQIRGLNEQAILSENDRAKEAAMRFSNVGIFVTVFALAAALFLAYRMMNMALRPLAIIAKHAESLGSGNLSERLTIPRDDEIGHLADSFNEMATRFSEMQNANVRRLERAQRMSDAALDSLYDPVIVTDARLRIVHLNRAAQDIFGPVASSPRTPLKDHISDPRILEALENAVDDQEIHASEDERSLVSLTVDGKEQIYRMRVTPMVTDANFRLGAVAVLEDVTYLRILDRMKTEFIGVAAHELRTPVSSMLLAVQLLEEGAAGELTPDQKQLVAVQRDDLFRLKKLTKDLLDVTRLESGTLPPALRLVSPAGLMDDLAHTMMPIAEQKGVHLTVEIEPDLPEILADATQIGQVLTNLVNNAVRHTPENGAITVRALHRENQVSFEVHDTGEGIPQDYLRRIFERFVQVPGATQGGAGLGLSIAQKIVRNHGGDMSVNSELGEGSVFRFWIPIAAPPREETNA